MPPSKHDHFHPILILPVKIVELPQQHANTTVYWLKTLPLPVAAKSSILNVAEFLDPSLKTSPYTRTNPVSCENKHFSYSRMLPTLSKVIVFFSVTFYSMMKYF